ncbi:arsenate reductase ArsC [Rhodobacteraceae bacterium NNCM2]|nr:arsenate reductase ArsC [Coraliihabitans acroporae]
MFNVLVLCTGNATRSILAEAILNRDGGERIAAYSAGSNPIGRVHPAATALLERRGIPVNGYRSKSWDEFAAPGAPELDLVITVCPSAAAEVMPDWPGSPMTIHWAIDEPAVAPADQIDLAFQLAYHQLSSRINRFLALPFETMSRPELRRALTRIARD